MAMPESSVGPDIRRGARTFGRLSRSARWVASHVSIGMMTGTLTLMRSLLGRSLRVRLSMQLHRKVPV